MSRTLTANCRKAKKLELVLRGVTYGSIGNEFVETLGGDAWVT